MSDQFFLNSLTWDGMSLKLNSRYDGPVIQYDSHGHPVLVGLRNSGPIACGEAETPDILLKVGSIPNLVDFLPSTVVTSDAKQVFVTPTPSITPKHNETDVSEPLDEPSVPVRFIIAILAGIGLAIVVLVIATCFCCVF